MGTKRRKSRAIDVVQPREGEVKKILGRSESRKMGIVLDEWWWRMKHAVSRSRSVSRYR